MKRQKIIVTPKAPRVRVPSIGWLAARHIVARFVAETEVDQAAQQTFMQSDQIVRHEGLGELIRSRSRKPAA